MNKMFTAVATLQLVEAGKLALDDTVGKHLPDYPNKDVASKVRVRHLLTHTGGTGDIFGPEYDVTAWQLREHSDYVKLYGSRPLRIDPPGALFEYSNYGFVLLGAIVEAVSGESVLRLRPRARLPSRRHDVDGLAARVRGRTEPLGRLHASLLWRPLVAAQHRLASLAGHRRRGRLLDGRRHRALRRRADESTSSSVPTPRSCCSAGKVYLGPAFSYAFGFLDGRDSEGNGWVGHRGGAPGMNGDLRIYP